MMTSQRERKSGNSSIGGSWDCICTVAEEITAAAFACAVLVIQMSEGGTGPLSVHFNELGSYPRYQLEVF